MPSLTIFHQHQKKYHVKTLYNFIAGILTCLLLVVYIYVGTKESTLVKYVNVVQRSRLVNDLPSSSLPQTHACTM